MSTGQDSTPAIACTLGSAEAGSQVQRWLRLVRDAGIGRAETADGVRVRFRDQPGAEQELRSLAAVEATCCAWARWDVHRAGGELILRVTSTPGEAAALQAMFGAGPVPGAAPD